MALESKSIQSKTNAKPSSCKKPAVLLLQMGGPDDIAGIQEFLFNLFRDKYIIQLPEFLQPFQTQFADFVSSRRAPKVAKLYEEIGGGSPIRFETECQATALAKHLNNNSDENYKCYIAMRYSNPFLAETLKQMVADGIDDLTVIPLYPHYSIATSGSSIIECQELFDESGFSKTTKIRYIESWETNDYFIQLLVKRIQDGIQEFVDEGICNPYLNPARLHILFSAHGLPESYVLNGDPYQEQIKASIKAIMERLPDHRHSLAYQSRVGPVKWLGPSTDKEIKRLAKEEGIKNLLVVPISFVGDHIETLHEIGIEYKEFALEKGIENFKITRLPKANPLLIKALASLI